MNDVIAAAQVRHKGNQAQRMARDMQRCPYTTGSSTCALLQSHIPAIVRRI